MREDSQAPTRRSARALKRSRPLLVVLAVAATVAAGGCSKSTSKPIPTHAVTGAVTLSGNLRDDNGTFVDKRLVDDADGVRVYLVRAGIVVDSVLTINGGYRLVGQAGAGYTVSARGGPGVSFASAAFDIGAGDVTIAAPLELTSVGDLTAAPTPFETKVRIHYDLAATGPVQMQAFDLAGLRVATLVDQAAAPPGAHWVIWDGSDDAAQPLPDGAYWIVFSGDGNDWAELVFKES
jgi:hypothetical protein